MNGRDHGAIERGIQLAPFACRHHRSRRKAQGLEHHADAHRIDGKHLPHQGDRRPRIAPAARRLDRALRSFGSRIAQHGTREYVFGLRMRRHAETRHIDTDDTNAVDFLRQQLQRNPGRRGHAQIDDDHGVVERRIGEFEDRLANVLEQLSGDQGLGVERHVADTATRAVEVRCKRQTVHTARGAGQDGGRASHAQADP